MFLFKKAIIKTMRRKGLSAKEAMDKLNGPVRRGKPPRSQPFEDMLKFDDQRFLTEY